MGPDDLRDACKWAQARVEWQLASDAHGYTLYIEDGGPGITEALRRDVLERDVRLDEQVSGHGLGLGIARDIGEAWGGSIVLHDSALGGLRVAIHLPARRSA